MPDQTLSFFRWREIPGSVWMLGLVSLFMDVSSEMIHALLPLYLVSVLGASTLEVGVIEGIAEALTPKKRLTVRATAADGSTKTFTVICRIDTPIEVDYYTHGGILQYVLRQLVRS